MPGAKTPLGFHPFVKPLPGSCRESAVAGTPYGGCASPADCPAGGENPAGFHPIVKPLPILAERTAAGRQSTPLRRLCFPFGRAMPP
ncbi:MAG: hypothetical protein LBK61_00050 [Spirochaetaceae bacterium]|nr:hypothetical protein [Spirochaetaceae bacterium]